MSSTNGDHLKEYYAAFDDDNIREIARVKLATNSESNRGTVLIQASLLEKRLKDLAEASLNDTKETRELFADRGPLDSFYAATLIARSLGLVTDDECTDLKLIRKIRNSFAHAVECSFEDDSIRDRVGRLSQGVENIDLSTCSGADRFRMVSSALTMRIYDRWKQLKEQKTSK